MLLFIVCNSIVPARFASHTLRRTCTRLVWRRAYRTQGARCSVRRSEDGKWDVPMSTETVDVTRLSPMMAHYVQTKRAAPEHMLLYRVGDFYEAFFEDAAALSECCDIALTSKDGGRALSARVPMSGVPHHALHSKLRPLLDAGLSVAIAEQMEPAQPGAALVERRVTRVLTPGTLADSDFLPARVATFIAAVHMGVSGALSVAVADVSTGDIRSGTMRDTGALRDLLVRERPAEVVVSAPKFVVKVINAVSHAPLRLRDELGGDNAEQLLRAYVKAVDKDARLEEARPLKEGDAVLELDAACVRNMELVTSMRGADKRRSLVHAVDRAVTSMGARRVRALLLEPLCAFAPIQARHAVVEALFMDAEARMQLRLLLRPVADIERLAGRVASGRASPREVHALAASLAQLPQIAEVATSALRVTKAADGRATALVDAVRPTADVLALAVSAVQALVDPAPPLLTTEVIFAECIRGADSISSVFVAGHDAELDSLCEHALKPSLLVGEFERGEQKRSGWQQLRVKHVKKMGYVIRVPRSLGERVVDEDPHAFSRLGYERVQSTKAELRFRSKRLMELECAHHCAVSGVIRRELELFSELCSALGAHAASMRAAASALALLDSLAGFAELARERDYVRPDMRAADERFLSVTHCRHAVVEQQLGDHRDYVPNSLALGGPAHPDTIILTGPNAAGKSCAIRSIALCVILAQAGSFVPASAARLSICDRVLTRVGAVDDVADSMSSFQIEMSETAAILQRATSHSLVLLDEVGRGTGVVDGMGIACAVAEALARGGNGAPPPKTLFVTHYHELNVLAEVHANISAMAMQVECADDDKLVATHLVIPGAGYGSLGVECARKVGFPVDVLRRAEQVSSALRLPARALGRALLAEFEVSSDGDAESETAVERDDMPSEYERGYRDAVEEMSKNIHALLDNRFALPTSKV